MAIGDRSDGVRLRKLPGFRKIFPYLMPTRTESVIFSSQRLKIGKTLRWLEKASAGREKRLSFFYVVLAAGVRALALRPDANRFVSGRHIYQRRTIDLSFVVKRALDEQASETTLKLTFDPRSTISDVVERVSSAVQATKRSSTSSDEKIAEILTSLPGPVTRLAVWAIRTLDYFGLLPASFIKGDAFHSSAFLANLGSIGLDAVSHHMYEWGNTPFFVVVGKRKKEPIVNERGELEVHDVVDMTFSVDERITDGVYYAGAIGLFTDLIENPERLEVPPENLPDPFALA
jgi:hypothetical protein